MVDIIGAVLRPEPQLDASSNGVSYLRGLDSTGRSIRAHARATANDWNVNSTRTASQNRAAMETALASIAGDGGGDLALLPSDDPYSIEPFPIPSSVKVRGLGAENTVLSYNESVGVDFLEFELASGSYKWGGLRDLTVLNASATVGGMAVYTPVDAAAFSADTHWVFEGVQFRGAGFGKYLRIGDANQGTVRACEWRGPYNATITDVGQAATTAIELVAATGCIGIDISNIMIVGVRTGIHNGDNVEGNFLQASEIVGGWDGITFDPASSKPGTFVDDMHINVNHRCIDILRKRDLQIGKVQLYRSNGYFDHSGDWHGILATDSDGVSVENAIVRVIDAFPTAGTIHGIELNNCDEASIGLITVREATSVDKVLKITDCVGGRLGAMISYSNPTRLEYAGSSSKWAFGKFIERGTTPTSPYTISASNKAVSFERTASADENYTETNLSIALTDVLYVGVDAQYRKYNVAVGAGVYVVNLDLDTATAVKGDVFEFRFTFLNSTNGTVNIRQGSGGSNIVVLNNGTGANWFPCLRMVNNGAGWTLFDQHNSVV